MNFRHGATEVKGEDEASGSSRKPVVYGTGYRLGTGNEPQEVVQGPPRPKQPVFDFKIINFKYNKIWDLETKLTIESSCFKIMEKWFQHRWWPTKIIFRSAK